MQTKPRDTEPVNEACLCFSGGAEFHSSSDLYTARCAIPVTAENHGPQASPSIALIYSNSSTNKQSIVQTNVSE